MSKQDNLVQEQGKEYHRMISEYIEDLKTKRGNIDQMDDQLENHLDAIMTENALLNDEGLDLMMDEGEDESYKQNLGKYKMMMMDMIKEEKGEKEKGSGLFKESII